MTEIAKLTAKLEADTQQFDRSMKNSNKHMEDAKKLVDEWAEEFEKAADDVDDHIKKLEKRIKDLEQQNEKSTKGMGKVTDELKDNIDKNADYIKKKYGEINEANDKAAKKASDFSKVLKYSIYTATAGLAGLTTFAVVKQQAFEMNRELDETIRLMRQLSGTSGEQVARSIFDVKGPIGRGALTSAAYQMLASRQSPQSVQSNLELLADTTFGLGGDDTTFNQLATGLTMMGSRGTELEGYSALAASGLRVDEYIKPLGDGSTLEALSRIERAAVTTEDVVNSVLEGLNKDFAGLIDTQEKTYTAAIDSIGQYFEQTSMKFGDTWYKNIKRSANRLADFLQSDEWQAKTEEMIDALNSAFETVGERAAQIGQSLQPAAKALADMTISAVELGAVVVQSAEPSIGLIAKGIEGASKGVSNFAKGIEWVIDKLKGLGPIISAALVAKTVKGLAMATAHAKATKDLVQFVRKNIGETGNKVINQVGKMNKSFSDVAKQARAVIPNTFDGIERGVRNVAAGAKKGWKDAMDGIRKGAEEAAPRVNKTFRTFTGGIVGMVKETKNITIGTAKAAAAGLNVISDGFVKTIVKMRSSVARFAKASTAAMVSFGKGVAKVGKWLGQFYLPAAGVALVMKGVADAFQAHRDVSLRAADATATFNEKLSDQIDLFRRLSTAHRSGSGSAPEIMGSKERIESLLFRDDEQREMMYRAYKGVTGRHAEDPMTMLMTDYGSSTDVIGRYLASRGLEYDRSATRNEGLFGLTGIGTVINAARGRFPDPIRAGFSANSQIEQLIRQNTGVRDSPSGITGWLGSAGSSILGLVTDERGRLKDMVPGLTDMDITNISEELKNFQALEEQRENARANMLSSGSKMLADFAIEHGFVDKNLQQRADRQGITYQEAERRALQEGTHFSNSKARGIMGMNYYGQRTLQDTIRMNFEGKDVSEMFTSFVDAMSNVEQEVNAINQRHRSTMKALADADAGAMLFNSRGLKTATTALADMARAALTAADSMESIGAAASLVLSRTTNLLNVSDTSALAGMIESTAYGIASNFEGGLTVTEQGGSVANTAAQFAEQFVSILRAQATDMDFALRDSDVRDATEFATTYATQSIVGRTFAYDNIPKDARDKVLSNWGAETMFDKPMEVPSVVKYLMEGTGFGQVLRENDPFVKALQENTMSIDRNTSSNENKVMAYGEDGHLILKPGQTWDANLGVTDVLRTGELMDARITQDIPNLSLGGGGGSSRASEILLEPYPGLQPNATDRAALAARQVQEDQIANIVPPTGIKYGQLTQIDVDHILSQYEALNARRKDEAQRIGRIEYMEVNEATQSIEQAYITVSSAELDRTASGAYMPNSFGQYPVGEMTVNLMLLDEGGDPRATRLVGNPSLTDDMPVNVKVNGRSVTGRTGTADPFNEPWNSQSRGLQ